MSASSQAPARGAVPFAADALSFGVLAALAALFVLARARTLFVEVLDTDETIFHAIGERLVGGERLYVDVFDLKPPGVFAFYAAVRALFGPGLFAVHAVTSVLVAGVAFALARAARGLSGSSLAGLLAAGLYLALHGVGDAASGAATSTELLASVPICAGVAWLSTAGVAPSLSRLFGVGALVGLSITFKPQAGAALLAILAWLAFFSAAPSSRRVLGAAVVGLGALAACAAVFSYFAATDRAAAFWRWSVTEGLAYAGRAGAFADGQWRSLFEFLALHLVPLALAIAGSRTMAPGPRALLLLWFLAALGASALGGRFYWNYFVLVSPPLALLAGLGAAPLWALLRPWARASLVALVVLPSLGSQAWLWRAEAHGQGSLRGGHRALALQARARMRAGEALYAFGSTAPVYYAAGVAGIEPFLITDYLFGFVHPTLLAEATHVEAFALPERLAELRAVLADPRVRVLVDAPYSAWRGHSMESVAKVMAIVRDLGYRKVWSGERGGVWERPR